jgi:single-strand DNA-binding protein
MASLNKVMLIGNLGRDPESRVLQSGMATNFSIATTRRYRSGSGEVVSETEWHNISMFGKLAEIAAQYLKKGSAVYIEGPHPLAQVPEQGRHGEDGIRDHRRPDADAL